MPRLQAAITPSGTAITTDNTLSAVLLDTRIVAHRGDGPASSLEWAVSAAASISVHLARTGFEVRLITDIGTEVSSAGLAGADLDGDPVERRDTTKADADLAGGQQRGIGAHARCPPIRSRRLSRLRAIARFWISSVPS